MQVYSQLGWKLTGNNYYILLETGRYLLGISGNIWGSEVSSVVFTFILMEGHCIFGIWLGYCHRSDADLNSLFPVRAFYPCQGRPIKAQEQQRAGADHTRQTTVNQCLILKFLVLEETHRQLYFCELLIHVGYEIYFE